MGCEADADAHVAEGVLEDEVPADDPRDQLSERRVGVGVRGARNGDHRRELGVAESGERADDSDEDQRDRQRWACAGTAGDRAVVEDEVDDRRVAEGGKCSRLAADRDADDGEDTRPDDRADTERSERDRTKRLLQRVFGLLRFRDQLVDRFGSKDLPGQRARSCLRKNWCGAVQNIRCDLLCCATVLHGRAGALPGRATLRLTGMLSACSGRVTPCGLWPSFRRGRGCGRPWGQPSCELRALPSCVPSCR